MKKFFGILLAFVLISNFVFAEENVAAVQSLSENEIKFTGWKTAQTEHFDFIFEEASRKDAEVYAQYADDAWNKIAKIYAAPQDKTKIYITGRTNTVNAYTYFSPTEIMMFTTPIMVPDFTFRDDWHKLFFTHELVHIANVNFEGKSKVASKIFGPITRTLDLAGVPGWALEGLTTVLETELTNGGRGRSPYFELMYKAPTLDNAFISYSDIGLEVEPPRGQTYVMGYLIMRSIADRWGLQALSDIERNRSFTVSWEDSVRLVTGETAEDIYKDVRIALAKKYSSERSIPEGIIISPRGTGTYYYKPAIVNDDGTIITIRKSASQDNAVVKLDPSAKYGRNFIEDTNPEKDLNTVMRETILFTGNFSDSLAVTADENGNIYASMAFQRNDRMPGNEVEYALFKWNKKTGLKQLTKKHSLFQPSVSRDGKTLVAVEQNGLETKIVQVNVETGEIKNLIDENKISFVQPSVNKDGSKITFLALDNVRPKVAVASAENNFSSYEVFANGEGVITDPAYPSWNSDGNLTYTSNARGRLEVFEAENSNGKYISTPVVSDPIGATWAYKNEKGIYYSSYASTGSVIKMKPLTEWGIVPEKDGPSAAGKIICFGNLENDYPEYKPYVIPSEVEVADDEENKDVEKTNKDKNTKTPVAVRGKKILHRTEENMKFAENSNSTVVTLQNEKKYIPLPEPYLYTPFVDIAYSGTNNKKINFGVNYTALFLTPNIQMNSGFMALSASYFPELNNFNAEFDYFTQIGSSQLNLIAKRDFLNVKDLDGVYNFTESNNFIADFHLPFVHKMQNKNEIYFGAFISASDVLSRKDNEVFSITSELPYENTIFSTAGLDFKLSKNIEKDIVKSVEAKAYGIGYFSIEDSLALFGVEAKISYTSGGNNFKYNLSVAGRYTDFPSDTIFTTSESNLTGFINDWTYPGRVVFHIGAVKPNFLLQGLNFSLFTEQLISFGTNTITSNTPTSDGLFNLSIDNPLLLGAELSVQGGYNFYVATGYSLLVDFLSEQIVDDSVYLKVVFNGFEF